MLLAASPASGQAAPHAARYFEVAAEYGFVALAGGLDYRASPDWAEKLGISPDGLVEFQLRSIDFLREVARPFAGQIPQILFAGVVGPRGDAYGQNRTITAEEAEDSGGVRARAGAGRGENARRLPHLDIWGGCCGTWDDHLREIAGRVRPLETAA